MKIPFNLPHVFGEESLHVQEVISSGNIAGNGIFTRKCQQFFKNQFGVPHCLLTNSCTAALEMTAILMDIQPGDEVIVPAYGYVSTANAFVLRGAKLVFADSMNDSPNMDIALLPHLITKKTKAIVVMHYAGIGVDMNEVMNLANSHNIFVVEDAAHGVDAYYQGRPLGTLGHFGTLSFHSSKNITSGHGGLLIVNDLKYIDRSNVIWQKGTDKTKYDLGHQGYYEWIDIGSSFFPSELSAAYLFGQLLHLEEVTAKRLKLWRHYYDGLKDIDAFDVPLFPRDVKHNGHIFYIKTKNEKVRSTIIEHLNSKNISAYSHYLSLSESPFYSEPEYLHNTHSWEKQMLRLPMYFELTLEQVDTVVREIQEALNIQKPINQS